MRDGETMFGAKGLLRADSERPCAVPHAIRAVLRFALADLLFMAVAVPGLRPGGWVELIAFVAGAAWPIPPDRFLPLIRGFAGRGGDTACYATCAVGNFPDHGAGDGWRLIGAIDREVH